MMFESVQPFIERHVYAQRLLGVRPAKTVPTRFEDKIISYTLLKSPSQRPYFSPFSLSISHPPSSYKNHPKPAYKSTIPIPSLLLNPPKTLSLSLFWLCFLHLLLSAMEATLKLSTKIPLLLFVLLVLSIAVSAQKGSDIAPSPLPVSGANSAMPVLGAVVITSLMSFIALLSHWGLLFCWIPLRMGWLEERFYEYLILWWVGGFWILFICFTYSSSPPCVCGGELVDFSMMGYHRQRESFVDWEL